MRMGTQFFYLVFFDFPDIFFKEVCNSINFLIFYYFILLLLFFYLFLNFLGHRYFKGRDRKDSKIF